MNIMLFADVNVGSIVLIVALLALLVMYPVMMFKKNKREQDKQNVLVESLTVGQYVITYSGVFGKIVEIKEKEFGRFITLETGEAHKNYVTVSVNAVYTITNNNPKVLDNDGKEIKDEKPKAKKVSTTKTTKATKTTKKEPNKSTKK